MEFPIKMDDEDLQLFRKELCVAGGYDIYSESKRRPSRRYSIYDYERPLPDGTHRLVASYYRNDDGYWIRDFYAVEALVRGFS